MKNISLSVTPEQVVEELQQFAKPERIIGMQRYGISAKKMLGCSQPEIKTIAKALGKNHSLALQLWDTEVHEAMHVAALIADPKMMTDAEINHWRNGMYSWDLVDGTMTNCFRKLPKAREYPFTWAHDSGEFQRRTAFSLMAFLAVHNKKDPDEFFLSYMPLVMQYADDERNFVKKAVSWAVRSVGKRSMYLNKAILPYAQELSNSSSKSARWIASDVIRELTNPQTLALIKR